MDRFGTFLYLCVICSDCTYKLPCKIWSLYLKKWVSYAQFSIWRPLCFLAAIFFWKLFGLYIQTSMQNLNSTAQEMTELCSILPFGGHFVFQNFVKKWVSYAQFCDLAAILFLKIWSKFVQTVHTNFHAKSGLCSSRNKRGLHNFAIWRPFCFLAAI